MVYKLYWMTCSNFLVLLASSAMSDKQTRVCLTQEVVRACRNNSQSLPKEARAHTVSKLSLRMKDSGYSAVFRYETIVAGVTAYERQVEREKDGTCPKYRPKAYKQDERRKKRETKKMSWYRPYDTVLFCLPTPDSKLVKRLRAGMEQEAKTIGVKVKVVERAGRKLSHQVPELMVQQECQEQQCFLHQTGGKRDCRRVGVVYRGTCTTCKHLGPNTNPIEVAGEDVVVEVEERTPGTSATYTGESGFTLQVRVGQHLEALRNPQSHKYNTFVNPGSLYHRGEEQEVQFKLELVGHAPKPLERKS